MRIEALPFSFFESFLVNDLFLGGGTPGVFGTEVVTSPPSAKPEDMFGGGIPGVFGTAVLWLRRRHHKLGAFAPPNQLSHSEVPSQVLWYRNTLRFPWT